MTGYPDAPGHQDRDTSIDAAQSVAQVAPLLRDRVLKSICEAEATADECAARLDASILSIRPRLTELSNKRLIEDTGLRRANASGRKAIVWRAAA